MNRKWLVMMKDEIGVVRAWGKAPDEADAEDEARRQLRIYIDRKAHTFEVLRESDFTVETVQIDDDQLGGTV